MSRSFHARKGLAWGQVALGWVCAQGLLTLLPIAPPGWGPVFLIAAGGGFAVWALMGLARALSRRPMLVVGPEGVTAAGEAIPWAEITAWRALPAERRVALTLARGRPAAGLGRLLPWRGTRGFDARLIDASLTDIVRAFRDVRPDLESPV